jgi:hypothetical protein
MTDPYETLGVPKDAAPEEIKKAFRRKAKAHHPDREGGDAKQMALVNKAYDTLGDEEKRKRFDETGDTKGSPTIGEEALARFGQLITELLKMPDINLISTAKSKLSGYDQQSAQALTQLKKSIATLTKRRGKIRVKKGKHNVVHTIIDGQLADLNRNIEHVEHGNAVMERVRELLEDYESDEAPPQPPQSPYADAQGIEALLGGLRGQRF